MKKHSTTPWNVSLNYLAKKNRTEKEMRTHLVRYEFSHEEVDDCIERLKAQGYIDDREYARHSLMKKYMQKNDSTAMIRQRLKNEGIKQEIIEEIMENMDKEYESDAFERFLHKEVRYKEEKDIRWEKIYRKAMRLGFDSSMIYLHAQAKQNDEEQTSSEGEDL